MDMLWECKACCMAGKEDHMKPMSDFNVRSNHEFLTRLLPQGAWARCVACNKERQGALGAAFGAATGGANDVAQQSKEVAAKAMAMCSQCDKTLPRTFFWPGDWRNWLRPSDIACKACCPLAPGKRKKPHGPKGLLFVTCTRCGKELGRSKFRPADLAKNITRGVVCLDCRSA